MTDHTKLEADKIRIATANNACVVCGDVLMLDPVPPHCENCDPEDPDVEWCEQNVTPSPAAELVDAARAMVALWDAPHPVVGPHGMRVCIATLRTALASIDAEPPDSIHSLIRTVARMRAAGEGQPAGGARKNRDTPEGRRLWAAAERAAEKVATWPDWKRVPGGERRATAEATEGEGMDAARAVLTSLRDPERWRRSRNARVERLADIVLHPHSPTKTRGDLVKMIEDFVEEHEGDVLLTERGIVYRHEEYVRAEPPTPQDAPAAGDPAPVRCGRDCPGCMDCS